MNLTKKHVVDTGSRVTYSVFVGALIDYFLGGLSGWGIVSARFTATGINSVTSGPYGWWQDKWYSLMKVTPEKRKLKDIFDKKDISDYLTKQNTKEILLYSGRKLYRWSADMLAFNTFEPFVYGIANSVGQLIDAGDVDFNQVYEGMKGVMYISPLVAPTMRLAISGGRKLFGLKTSAELAEKNLDDII
ncbi:L-alanine exporter AlaE [Candidatus Woesearchaeota archaeon]|nr:L-alanine exporter AlaE [Candidatus Woesearchaeota archaeon]MCF7900985.1 L-alanine exporter AlaE [Candidatus Woesearchaeota archaeon]MCF8013299.1 L-alanine exporter AlaE [Candidatus Woesearchaeota archaeon]